MMMESLIDLHWSVLFPVSGPLPPPEYRGRRVDWDAWKRMLD